MLLCSITIIIAVIGFKSIGILEFSSPIPGNSAILLQHHTSPNDVRGQKCNWESWTQGVQEIILRECSKRRFSSFVLLFWKQVFSHQALFLNEVFYVLHVKFHIFSLTCELIISQKLDYCHILFKKNISARKALSWILHFSFITCRSFSRSDVPDTGNKVIEGEGKSRVRKGNRYMIR